MSSNLDDLGKRLDDVRKRSAETDARALRLLREVRQPAKMTVWQSIVMWVILALLVATAILLLAWTALHLLLAILAMVHQIG